MKSTDALVIVELVRDRDAWQRLALQAIETLERVQKLDNHVGGHLQQVRDIERTLLVTALLRNGGNKSATARYLGITPKTIRSKCKNLKVHVPKVRA